MAASTDADGPNVDMRTYWTNRDFKTSLRLFMQHWMWQHELGFSLHPKIPEEIRSKPDLKIADVACGNGAWLFELKAPETTQLDGYDLSPNCFGAKEWLPKNVTLTGGFDALQPLTEELKGKYDIVHVRAFASIPKNNNIAPFIQTLMGLLKPGGYLQWEESHPGKLNARTINDSVQSAASKGLVQLMLSSGAQTGMLFDWITNIQSEVEKEGMEIVSYKDVEWRSEFQKGWNDNLLTVYEELAIHFPLAKDAPPNLPMTRETYTAMFGGVVNECHNGVWLHQPGLSLLAKKP